MRKIGPVNRHKAGVTKPKWIILVPLTICVVLIAIWYMGGSSSHNMTAPFVINATAKHTATVIFLHGLGDTGQGWSQALGSELVRASHIKYVCPTAQVIPVTLNGGMRMPSWFDIRGLSPDSDEDELGIKEASNRLQHYVSEEEKNGIPRNRIVVGGFSQGGALALYSALTTPKPPLAGILGLSMWLPLHRGFPQAMKSNQETPVLQCHGEADPLVCLDFGNLTAQLLKSFNPKHTFKTYPHMGHSSCEEEMKDVKEFLDKYLPAI